MAEVTDIRVTIDGKDYTAGEIAGAIRGFFSILSWMKRRNIVIVRHLGGLTIDPSVAAFEILNESDEYWLAEDTSPLGYLTPVQRTGQHG